MIPLFIILHHSADSSPDPQFAKVNGVHRKEGFPESTLGYFVGYHYFIGKDGSIKQARKEDEAGSHDTNCGCDIDLSGLPPKTINAHSIGICLAGDFTNQIPTDAQIKSLSDLVDAVQARHDISDQKILLHRETKATACPGVNLRELVFMHRITSLRHRLEVAEKAFSNPVVTVARKSLLGLFIEQLKKLIGMK